MTDQLIKDFTEYIDAETVSYHSLTDYAKRPCSVFLKEISSIEKTITYCKKNLPKSTKAKPTYSDQALSTLTIAALGILMGQFELYQRFTFSSTFELSRYMPKFDLDRCIKSLQKESNLQLDICHLSAYRGQPAPIGQLIADNLSGWHMPRKVNFHMKAILNNLDFYSTVDIEALRVLWQLRHTMVHTGGWLTLPDAQKIPELSKHGDKAIFFYDGFTEAVVRRFHVIAARSTERLSKALNDNLSADVLASKEFKDLVNISSPKRSWIPRV